MLSDPAVALTILVLSLFVGIEIISKVPPLLHTPLMSGSNAISGVTIVGALFAITSETPLISTIFGFAAVVFAMVNVVGGFLVTNRMLAMFRKRKDAK
jgi:NAD(P) transhydrogenase subunit alpha